MFTENGPPLSRLPVLGYRVVSCVCCGARARCQAALHASSWPHVHARHSRPPTFYIHAGSWSTTGIEPDSVPAARLPEGEPEPRHTCLRCLVRWKGMGRLQGVVGLVTSILLRVASPSTVSPLEGTWHTQSSDASSGVVSERQTWSNPPVFVTGDSGESCCCLLGGSSPLLR